MSPIQIRQATPEDWPAIWPFLREIVAAGETYTLPRDIAEDEAREMWMVEPEHTAVAVDDYASVLGSAKMGANHSGPAAHIASASYMVNPAHGRRGVGRALGSTRSNGPSRRATVRCSSTPSWKPTWGPWRYGARWASG